MSPQSPITENSSQQLFEALQPIQDNINLLNSLLRKNQRCSLPKKSEGTVSFVRESLQKAIEHEEIIPQQVDVSEIAAKVELIDQIEKALQPLEQMRSQLLQAATFMASEVYIPCLGIHNAIKLHEIQQARHEQEAIDLAVV
ncbi:hypothetical protein [Persicobacter psychrovividus]|uniref:Uncharacterized protein n=1 Tax=Persicobacter psychrovividus TaxID=387638 RepID=A0ABN6L9C6_9BACT|nr:hypothetical protein PEPS_02120 [Persicobacter psychrovividus]